MNTQKNSLLVPIIVILIAVAIGAYVYFTRGEGGEAVLEREVKTDEAVGKDLLLSLMKLKAIKLDSDIFKDPVFLSLDDFTIELLAQPVGRSNPFLPLGRGGGASTTTAPAKGAPVTKR